MTEFNWFAHNFVLNYLSKLYDFFYLHRSGNRRCIFRLYRMLFKNFPRKANATVRVARDALCEETDKFQRLRVHLSDECKECKMNRTSRSNKPDHADSALGVICRAQKHEQIITQQKLALAELRTRIHNIFSTEMQGKCETCIFNLSFLLALLTQAYWAAFHELKGRESRATVFPFYPFIN